MNKPIDLSHEDVGYILVALQDLKKDYAERSNTAHHIGRPDLAPPWINMVDEVDELQDRIRADFNTNVRPNVALNPRRPLDDDNPEWYQESDRDFVLNNLDACVAFLERGTQYNPVVRMWINQPSTSQPLNRLHGTCVLAQDDGGRVARVFFLSGHIVSQQVPNEALSLGWPT